MKKKNYFEPTISWLDIFSTCDVLLVSDNDTLIDADEIFGAKGL